MQWAAFSQLEPFGCTREDYRAGLAPAAIANLFKKADDKPTAPLDLFPDPAGDRAPEVVDLREMNPAEIREAAAKIAAGLGG